MFPTCQSENWECLAAYIESQQEAIGAVIKRFSTFYSHFPVINVADTTGKVILATNPEAVGKVNIGQREYFKKALLGQTVISGPLMSMDTTDKAVVVASSL